MKDSERKDVRNKLCLQVLFFFLIDIHKYLRIKMPTSFCLTLSPIKQYLSRDILLMLIRFLHNFVLCIPHLLI